MSGVAKLASPDPSVHSLTQACAELGHSSRTVTGRSFTVANRVRSRTFATLLLHEVYPTGALTSTVSLPLRDTPNEPRQREPGDSMRSVPQDELQLSRLRYGQSAPRGDFGYRIRPVRANQR